MSIALQYGQEISIVLYKGESLTEAQEMYGYLQEYQMKWKPVPIEGLSFPVSIRKINFTDEVTGYKLELKGVLDGVN